MKRNNYKNDYLHCPECLHQSLFGIKIKNNNSYIQYKCRLNHIGEIPISKFLKENDDTSIYSLICQYCKKEDKIMYYCYECSSFCSQEDCELKHSSNILQLLETTFIFHLEIFGKYDKDIQPLNINFIYLTSLVYHLDILGNDIKDIHPSNI